MNLNQKITLMIGGLVFASLVILSTIGFGIQQKLTRDIIVSELAERRDSARDGFESYLSSIDQDLALWASLPITARALSGFSTAWAELGADPTTTLQTLYITNNSHKTGEKDKLLFAPDGSSYSALHQELHRSFNALKDKRGYYDVFLIDPEGNIVYTVYKELDYATNLIDGPYANSGLGDVFRAASKAPKTEISFVDFAPYAPSYGAPASFIARKVVGADGSFLGVIAFQMPIDRLAALVGDLGHGTHAMVVGGDGLLRNTDNRFGDNSFLSQEISGIAVSSAIEGRSAGYVETREGVSYLQASAPLNFHGTTWAFVAEMPETVAFAPMRSSRNTMLLLAFGCIVVSALGAWQMARSISRPISSLSSTIRGLIDGNHDIKVAYVDRKDEIGEVAQSVSYFKAQFAKMEELKKQAAEVEKRERAARQEKRQAEAAALQKEHEEAEQKQREKEQQRQKEIRITEEIANVIEACANGNFDKRLTLDGKEGVLLELSMGVNRISEATNRGLNDISLTMAALAAGDLTYRIPDGSLGIFAKIAADVNASMESLTRIISSIHENAATANASVSEISASADTLARRTEHNAATLEETHSSLLTLMESVQSAKASTSAARASSVAVVNETENGIRIVEQTVIAMHEIKNSSSEIAQIIDLIESIAFQTNLLALNAGVEAARAGEEGRGFSVVASEVRALAARSSEAARQISELIADSGSKVEKGVELSGQSAQVLEGIAKSARDVSSQIDAVAVSSNDQAANIQDITQASTTLDRSTQENAAMFEETTAAIKVMKAEFDSLMGEVSAFVVNKDHSHEQRTGSGSSATESGASAPRLREVSTAQRTV